MKLDLIPQFLQTKAVDVSKTTDKTLIERIADFFDGDIVKIFTGIAAIIAFLISTSSFVISIIEKRRKLSAKFNIIKISSAVDNSGIKCDAVLIGFAFANKSQLPISITKVSLINGTDFYDCQPTPYPVEIATRIGGTKIDCKSVKTISPPIQISSLGATSGYITFFVPHNAVSKKQQSITIEICTNRGKRIIKTFDLNKENIIH